MFTKCTTSTFEMYICRTFCLAKFTLPLWFVRRARHFQCALVEEDRAENADKAWKKRKAAIAAESGKEAAKSDNSDDECGGGVELDSRFY